MQRLWFIVPVHGREKLTAICLRQLRRTCDALLENGVEASAVIVGDDISLRTASVLGFATIRQNNRFLSRKYNDGIQLACDPHWNPRPVDYVIPLGSDDWIDWRTLLDLPDNDTILGFQTISFVREDGRELHTKKIDYPGGVGIRVYPRTLLYGLGYRPGDQDLERGCDTSILNNLQRTQPRLKITYGNIDPRQIVDWKSPDTQLNDWNSLSRHPGVAEGDPFKRLAGFYPDEALREMRAHYESALVAA